MNENSWKQFFVQTNTDQNQNSQKSEKYDTE